MNADESQVCRQLAIIQAKNATPLQWKSKVKTAEADLPIMRRNMLHLVDEPDAVVSSSFSYAAYATVLIGFFD